MTPHNDTQLDALSDARQQASDRRTEWNEYLESCRKYLSALHEQNDSRIDWLSREGDNLYRQMVDAVTRSKDCYSNGDHGGAAEWSARGKDLKARLTAVNDEKNGLIAKVKEAQAKFNDARDNYRNVKAAHEATQRKFDDRLAELRRKKAAKAEAAAKRMGSKPLMQLAESGRAIVKRLAEEHTQFRDEEVKVTAQEGFDLDLRTRVMNIYIYHRDPAIHEHVHAVFRLDTGEELMCEYRDDD